MNDYPTYAASVHTALVATGTGIHAADALLKLHRARVEVAHFHGRDAAEIADQIRCIADPERTPLAPITTFAEVL